MTNCTTLFPEIAFLKVIYCLLDPIVDRIRHISSICAGSLHLSLHLFVGMRVSQKLIDALTDKLGHLRDTYFYTWGGCCSTGHWPGR